MLGKKTRKKNNDSTENTCKKGNTNLKKSNNKFEKKWFNYNSYPENYIMSIRDANILACRLRNNTSQGILKAEKKAFFNFFEFIKKSPRPSRADEIEVLIAALKHGRIKTIYNYNNDLSIEEKTDSNNSFLDIKRENEKILSLEKSEKMKNSKIDNFLEKSNEKINETKKKNKPKNDHQGAEIVIYSYNFIYYIFVYII